MKEREINLEISVETEEDPEDVKAMEHWKKVNACCLFATSISLIGAVLSFLYTWLLPCVIFSVVFLLSLAVWAWCSTPPKVSPDLEDIFDDDDMSSYYGAC